MAARQAWADIISSPFVVALFLGAIAFAVELYLFSR
jgi:hypothetical protein